MKSGLKWPTSWRKIISTRWCIPIKNAWSFPLGQRFRRTAPALLLPLAGFPAIEVPAGFSTPTADAPIGVPVGWSFSPRLGGARVDKARFRFGAGDAPARHQFPPPHWGAQQSAKTLNPLKAQACGFW